MPEVLQYATPKMIRPVSRSLLIGGAVQILMLLLAGSVLDEGSLVLTATARISAAYWVGVIVVLVRRSNHLTKGDHRYLKSGLFGLLIFGVPATLSLWSHWGIG